MATKPSSFGNSALSNAKRAKNDEFYTQWADIEREMNAYERIAIRRRAAK